MYKIDLRLSKEDIKPRVKKIILIELCTGIMSLGFLIYLKFNPFIIIAVASALVLTHFVVYTLSTQFKYMTLTTEGMEFHSPVGKSIKIKWNDSIEINESQHGFFLSLFFKQEGNPNQYVVPKTIFNQTEVTSFLKKYMPKGHKLETFIFD